MAVEITHVEIEQSLFHGHHGVAQPAEPFVALRTVHGIAHEVAALRPERGAVDAVDQFVAAGKGGKRIHRGMHHAAGQVVDRRGVGQAADLYIAKAVKSETGFIGLGPRPAEHIDIGVQGFFVAGEIQHTVCL